MRFRKIIANNNSNSITQLETLKNSIQNASLTAEEVLKRLEKIIEMLNMNSDLLDRESDYDQF